MLLGTLRNTITQPEAATRLGDDILVVQCTSVLTNYFIVTGADCLHPSARKPLDRVPHSFLVRGATGSNSKG